MLEFTAGLFVHLSPNERAWASNLSGFLRKGGYLLHTSDSLQRRFANSLAHYQVLVRLARAEMSQSIEAVWTTLLRLPPLHDKILIFQRDYLNAQSNIGHLPVQKPGEPFERPSVYLWTRCAACFGGGFWEAKVETIHSAKGPNVGKKRPRPSTSLADEGDRCEDGLHVPNSALQQCRDSFIAADENRIKASCTRFSDTGLMGLLCRHDHVLFLANMWTAGEKQFYALALIDALMKEIPCHWQVGLLYDIACQFHHALIKWKYLDVWLPRLQFATSVFHAYGHQWVCQLWYHPRKAQIWGLSDGEGCE
ncbi:hypothetical protein BS47DRAFT_1303577 [Hydnum rufescens UP504]|uniref:Uncharacterized protein n=1 Tax=Hydnum rufescens UP504 TaxID=1448309 RepID=A0A9P6AL29_9AGAM|nr:hypothetical protein BS47DRAFT_1303577 [Hydnum rufescens UP504]